MDNPEKLATRRGNQEWTIQRKWQYWVQKTQDKDKKIPHRKLGTNPPNIGLDLGAREE